MEAKEVRIHKIRREDNRADLQTKELESARFHQLVERLPLRAPQRGTGSKAALSAVLFLSAVQVAITTSVELQAYSDAKEVILRSDGNNSIFSFLKGFATCLAVLFLWRLVTKIHEFLVTKMRRTFSSATVSVGTQTERRSHPHFHNWSAVLLKAEACKVKPGAAVYLKEHCIALMNEYWLNDVV